jgi:hypothetical protein
MGVNMQTAQFLRAAIGRGVSFEHTLTLGRQDLYGDGPIRPAADLFRELGAEQLDALDASDYDGASVIHDLNDPMPEHLKRRYSVVFDGGTLEHVFNAGQALRHCLELVAPGGHYIGASPGNNQMGHGFYQFSPEFYHRALSREAGFKIDLLLAVEQRPLRPRWYKALDPAQCNRRIQLRSKYPVELLALAQRVSLPSEVATTPQQSDYVTAWGREDERKPSMKLRLHDALPPRIASVAVTLLSRSTSWSNGGFQPVDRARLAEI